jgi:large subunit ribosomal protein L4
MAKIEVYNLDRKSVSKLDLEESVFGAEIKKHLLHAVVRYQLAKRRQGTHKVKGRAEVSGGGRKPFKQKGTGRARAGTTRAVHWRGGGVVFGPVPRSYAFKLNKKTRRAALCGAISQRVSENKLVVLNDFNLSEIKTKSVVNFMNKFELTDMLVVTTEADETLNRSSRNVPGVMVLPSIGLNVYDILNHRNLVMTEGAVAAVTTRLGGPNGVE